MVNPYAYQPLVDVWPGAAFPPVCFGCGRPGCGPTECTLVLPPATGRIGSTALYHAFFRTCRKLTIPLCADCAHRIESRRRRAHAFSVGTAIWLIGMMAIPFLVPGAFASGLGLLFLLPLAVMVGGAFFAFSALRNGPCLAAKPWKPNHAEPQLEVARLTGIHPHAVHAVQASYRR